MLVHMRFRLMLLTSILKCTGHSRKSFGAVQAKAGGFKSGLKITCIKINIYICQIVAKLNPDLGPVGCLADDLLLTMSLLPTPIQALAMLILLGFAKLTVAS